MIILQAFKTKKRDLDIQSVPAAGVPLRSFWLMAFVAIALSVMAGIGVLLLLDGYRTRELTNQELDLRADVLTQRLSQSFGLYHGMLRGLAADPTLSRLLDTGNAASIASRERILARIIPGALRVRLLKPGYDRADLQADPPLSYASLALLRTAEMASEPPPLELHQSQRAKFYLVGATALRGADGHLHGLLHLSLSAHPLWKGIKRLRSSSPAVLQQLVNGQPVTLLDTPGPVMTQPDEIRPLAASQLRIAYWHKDVLESPLILPGLGIMVILIGIFSAVIGVQYWRLRKTLQADQTMLLHLLEDALAGRQIPRQPPVALQDLTQTVMALLQQFKVMRVQTSSIVPTPPPEIEVITQTGPKLAVKRDEARIASPRQETTPSPPASTALPKVIFHPHDIRGLVGQSLTPAVVYELGRAIGSQAQDQGQQTLVVARDGRSSGADLSTALITGLNASGCDAVDLGTAPIPMLYFATHFLGSNAGVMVTASHCPADHNGLKVVIDGEPVTGPGLLALRERVEQSRLRTGTGSSQEQDLTSAYIERITEDVSIARPLKVVVDCGGGCAGRLVPRLLHALGCEVVERLCEPDVSTPGYPPDPSRPENLKTLQDSVLSEQADVGFAFDGDGECLGVVDSRGHIIWPDRVLMLLSADVLSRHPGGDVVFDVNCSRALANQILQNGGRPVLWKSGYAPLRAKLRETGALLAGAWNGLIIFQERWYGFGDACYAGARLLEILALDPRSSAEVFGDFPEYLSTPQFVLEVQEGEQYSLIERLQQRIDLFGGAKLTTLDGLRAEYEDGWGLVRASNTMPALNFRFEADSEQVLERIQGVYRDLLAAAAPGLKAPF